MPRSMIATYAKMFPLYRVSENVFRGMVSSPSPSSVAPIKNRPRIYTFSASLLIALFLFAPLAFGACDPTKDRDCCLKDSDCIAYVYENLCTIMALNKKAVAKLERTPPTLMQMCTAEKLAELRKKAATKKPICEGEVCRWAVDDKR